MKNEKAIIIYQSEDGQAKVEVQLKNETVWLTQKQMAELFGKDVKTVNEHIKNVFDEGELDKNSVIRKFQITAIDGKIYSAFHYNLDVIISVGYRVKSLRGTKFRIWATKVLKNHLVQGYTIDQKRLLVAKEKLNDLNVAIDFIKEKARVEQLTGREQELFSLLASYSKTLSLLTQYDAGKIVAIKGEKSSFVLTYEKCQEIIAQLKNELIGKKETSNLFGAERDHSFEGIVKNLYQTFGGKELYETAQDKAAHLLYFTIKDHPFTDGNKRVASFLFVYFLHKCDLLYRQSGERKINDNALAVLALLVAESNPKEKEIILKIINNLLSD